MCVAIIFHSASGAPFNLNISDVSSGFLCFVTLSFLLRDHVEEQSFYPHRRGTHSLLPLDSETLIKNVSQHFAPDELFKGQRTKACLCWVTLQKGGQNDGKLAKCLLGLSGELTAEPRPQGTIWHQTAQAPCDCCCSSQSQAVTSHFQTINFISNSFQGIMFSAAFKHVERRMGF